ncbi:hypothetical protein NKI56_10460 [Mesorhizobium sp. M0622]|uniref:hypothetical protein n=1 Tax=unclassified Mesorhizobium TaxID=325217 RepID=UPI00333A28E7
MLQTRNPSGKGAITFFRNTNKINQLASLPQRNKRGCIAKVNAAAPKNEKSPFQSLFLRRLKYRSFCACHQ